jgi:hypothetical protein
MDAGESTLKRFNWEITAAHSANIFNTTPIQGPNLTVSSVSLSLIEGDGYVFNRSSTPNNIRRLAINVYDLENYSYVESANVSFWLTNETSQYRLENISQTDSNGNASFYFNPNCSHLAGGQYWIAGTTDVCYEVKNATQTNYTYNITGNLVLSITSPNGEKYLRGDYSDGQLVPLKGTIKDECGNWIENNPINFSVSQDTTTNYCTPIAFNSFNVSSTDSNSTELSLNSTNSTTIVKHLITRSTTAIWTEANLTINYLNTTPNRTEINVTVNGYELGTLEPANDSTSYTFTNVSVSWLQTTDNITYEGDFTNITLSYLSYYSNLDQYYNCSQ